MTYKILIKHNSDKKNNLWQSYGNSTTAIGSTDATFTEFSTEDLDVLRAEIIKLDSEVGHNNIRIVQDVEVTYGVEIVTDEAGTEETPTTPDNSTDTESGDTTIDNETGDEIAP